MSQLRTHATSRFVFHSLRRCIGSLLLLWLLGCAGRSGPSARKPYPKGQMHRVSGYVLDVASHHPLASVPVAANGAQTLTAKDGFFQLTYPATKREEYLRDQVEVLQVNSLDYAGSAAIPVDTAQRVTVLAVRNAYRFPPHGSLQPADSVHVSSCSVPWVGLPGTQRAFLLQNGTGQQTHKLRALTFRVGKEGVPREPFRVRIYRYTGPAEAPGEDLLTESYVIAQGEDGTFSYDVSSLDIVVPDGGFFLALEFAVSYDKFYTQKPIIGYVPVGPVLRPPYAFAATRTWNYTNQGWRRATPAENCWPLQESAVSAEVEPTQSQPEKR